MATLQQSASGKKDGDIRYLTPLNIETNKTKKYCRFKKSGIKYFVDSKEKEEKERLFLDSLKTTKIVNNKVLK